MTALEAVNRLRTSLDEVAGALAAPNETMLLAAERGLVTALTDLAAASRQIDPAEHPAITSVVADARAALARCRILGTMLNDVARATVSVIGPGDTYDRAGAVPVPSAYRGTTMKVRL